MALVASSGKEHRRICHFHSRRLQQERRSDRHDGRPAEGALLLPPPHGLQFRQIPHHSLYLHHSHLLHRPTPSFPLPFTTVSKSGVFLPSHHPDRIVAAADSARSARHSARPSPSAASSPPRPSSPTTAVIGSPPAIHVISPISRCYWLRCGARRLPFASAAGRTTLSAKMSNPESPSRAPGSEHRSTAASPPTH